MIQNIQNTLPQNINPKGIRLKKNKMVRVCLLCFCNNKGASGE
jgi:hypothetical protein